MPSGTKSFIVYYRMLSGRQRKMTIGRFGVLSVAQARRKALQILADVSSDKDPAAEVETSRKNPTFGDLADEYIKRRCSKKKSGPEDVRMIHRDLLKPWSKVPVMELNRRDVVRVLDTIMDRGAPIMANNTLRLITRMFNFGIDRGLLEFNPASRIKKPAKDKSRQRVLSEKEINKFWPKIDQMKGAGILVRSALKLILLTAQRPGEVISVEWDELDLVEGWWTIPKEKAKNGLAHRVALSPLVIEILEGIPRICSHVFPRRRGNGWIEGEHITIRSLPHAVRTNSDLFKLKRFTPHDLRRTAATHLGRLGFSNIVPRILNHKPRGITEQVYNLYSFDKEKKLALNTWSSELERIVTGNAAKVISINGGK